MRHIFVKFVQAERYRKAVERGYALSQYKPGTPYDKGEGVPKNPDKAREWWEKPLHRAMSPGLARKPYSGTAILIF